MSKLWLPGDSDFALSQREPNLLVPRRKPVGKYLPPDDALLFYDASFGASGVDLTGGTVAYVYTGAVTKGFDQYGGYQEGNNGILRVGDFVDIRGGYTITLDIDLSVIDASYGGTFVIPSDGGANTHWSLQRAAGGQTFRMYHGGTYDPINGITTTDLTSGGRHILTIAWDGSTVLVFLDGVKKEEHSFSSVPSYTGVMPGCYMFASRDLSTSYGSDGKVYSISVRPFKGEGYALEINRNPYIGCTPANATPYLIGLPSGGGAVEITVPQGNLTLSTAAPTVSVTASASIDVPQADLVLSTTAPTVSVSDHVDITVPQADLTLSTTAPTVQASANVSIEVPQADLSLSSEPPAVTTTDHVEIAPPAADLSLSSVAPTIAVSEDGAIIVPTAQLLLSTQAPTVELSNNIEITVPQGDLSLSTTAPKVGISWNIEVPQGTLSLSSTAPSVLQGFNVLVPGANLTLSPTAPVVATTAAVGITVPQGDLALEGFAPTVETTGVDIWTQVGAASTSWTEITSSSTVWTEI